jgi:hypothetical protein
VQSPPPHQGRFARIVPADDAGSVKLVVTNDEPIDRLFAAGQIDEPRWLVARLYAEAWYATGMQPSTAGGWDAPFDCSSVRAPMERLSDTQNRALEEWRRARRAIPQAWRAEVDRVVLWIEAPASVVHLADGLGALVQYYERCGREK